MAPEAHPDGPEVQDSAEADFPAEVSAVVAAAPGKATTPYSGILAYISMSPYVSNPNLS